MLVTSFLFPSGGPTAYLMADALANIACCFDASKDLGETSVELVICNCSVTKRCCIKWETFTFVAALVFSSVDFIADVFGYKSFVDTVSDKQKIQVYIDVWLALMIFSGVIILSEISLPLYSLINITGCCTKATMEEEDVDKYREKTKYWSRANNIAVVLTEDGVVALIKVLIAFRSVDAVQDLQETAGVVNSCIAFAVTFLRHCLLMMQIITKLSRNNVCFQSAQLGIWLLCKGNAGTLLLVLSHSVLFVLFDWFNRDVYGNIFEAVCCPS
ncbi:hypothetical protein EB796_022119 [Bugula neritina]|uniref:Uncharacterized protein n=1 Tax=Bugula neritina TaxID=10212 RepID=A0A7J7J1L4_BUGNE|nr:hypothetical protein EB796_022119 [Bugula neritina]